jgi:preprotein translocase subunit YajC
MDLIPLLLIFGVMYAVLILPQQRRAKAKRELLSSIEVGDQVLLNSGIYGFVEEVHGDILWVEISDGVEVKVARGAVAEKLPAVTTETAPEQATPDEGRTED